MFKTLSSKYLHEIAIRDESFITSWGGRLYSGGVGNFFGDVLGGGENKMTYGQGGSCISSGMGGGQIGSIGLSFH